MTFGYERGMQFLTGVYKACGGRPGKEVTADDAIARMINPIEHEELPELLNVLKDESEEAPLFTSNSDGLHIALTSQGAASVRAFDR